MNRSEMRRLVLMAAVAVMVMASIPALAAKPSGVTGSIELMAAPTALAASDAGGADLAYGGYAEFDARVDGKMTNNSSVYVTVVCSQGSEVVYQWSAAADFAFPLHDQAGQGLEWDGGAADCSGSLIYKVDKGRKYTLTTLDTTTFSVG